MLVLQYDDRGMAHLCVSRSRSDQTSSLPNRGQSALSDVSCRRRRRRCGHISRVIAQRRTPEHRHAVPTVMSHSASDGRGSHRDARRPRSPLVIPLVVPADCMLCGLGPTVRKFRQAGRPGIDLGRNRLADLPIALRRATRHFAGTVQELCLVPCGSGDGISKSAAAIRVFR